MRGLGDQGRFGGKHFVQIFELEAEALDGSGVRRNCRIQPSLRSWAIRTELFISAPLNDPNAAIAIM